MKVLKSTRPFFASASAAGRDHRALSASFFCITGPIIDPMQCWAMQ